VTRDKAHKRALSLVALATDAQSTEAEARTAALAACKLIDEHDLLSAAAPDDERDQGERAQDLRRVAEAGATLLEEILGRARARSKSKPRRS
jgi:hypothetical protein